MLTPHALTLGAAHIETGRLYNRRYHDERTCPAGRLPDWPCPLTGCGYGRVKSGMR